MKNEIKEKIRQWYIDDDLISILDYITNLQEENERLKNEPLTNKISRIDSVVSNIYRENEDYKSRFDKAVEYMKTIYFSLLSNNKNYNNLYIKLLDTKQGNKLLNILEGVDKDE